MVSWASRLGLVLAALRFGATVLHIPMRAISASFAPLDVHEYVFGCESCRTRLAFEWVRSAAAPIRSAVSHCWSSSSRVAAFRSRSRANRCMLSTSSFANSRAILRRRNTDFSSCAVFAKWPPNRMRLSPSARHSMPPPCSSRLILCCMGANRGAAEFLHDLHVLHG